MIAETTACNEPNWNLAATVVVVGNAVVELCNWQHGCAPFIAAISQPITIALQQWWLGGRAKQASSDVVVHKITTASIRIAPLLPMDTVYASCLNSSLVSAPPIGSD